MQHKIIHIIAHEVPYPPDFGGVIDLFYKVRTLHQLGIGIHLHCYTNKRPPQEELEAYCLSVHYYPREKTISWRLPYIIASRKSNLLLQRLNEDNHPILFEGVHCTYHLLSGALKDRVMLLRLHNVECEYYKQLFSHEKKIFQKIYFGVESLLLRKSEKVLAQKIMIAAVNEQDTFYYQNNFHAPHAFYLPVFTPHEKVKSALGNGNFCLYHGNLSINENEEAAIWLLKHVFNSIQIPFVIAGKNPSKKLEKWAHRKDHTCLVANPTDKELQDLISKAQVNILPSLNNTGVKLKLLNAVFNGRHCLVNQQGVEGSGLEDVCHIATDPQSYALKIKSLFGQPFDQKEIEKRQRLLDCSYSNLKNAKKLIASIWGSE